MVIKRKQEKTLIYNGNNTSKNVVKIITLNWNEVVQFPNKGKPIPHSNSTGLVFTNFFNIYSPDSKTWAIAFKTIAFQVWF